MNNITGDYDIILKLCINNKIIDYKKKFEAF